MRKTYFNSRSHEESDPRTQGLPAPPEYFNSRSHEESDCIDNGYEYYDSISIHALTKRATWMFRFLVDHLLISIHALTKRATAQRLRGQQLFSISIHALTKRATCAEEGEGGLREISIHALTKRATECRDHQRHRPSYFNSRSHEESDGCS